MIDRQENGVATVIMNRPDRCNAYNDDMIGRMTRIFQDLGADDSVRVVVLAAKGRFFSAGEDLNWMRKGAEAVFDANVADALGLAHMLKAVHQCPRPTVAVVQGPAFGGGVGLTAAFSLPEVTLGLIPAVIAPYLTAAIGARACRRYFLSAEGFSAHEAYRLGLVHEVVPDHGLAAVRDRIISSLLSAAPAAQRSAKDLIRAVADYPLDETMISDTAHRIAKARSSSEGREGTAAFLEKRKPWWFREALSSER